MTKLLREKYKTHDGAMKRCRFENAVAFSEHKRGYAAKLYRYRVIQDDSGVYRVERSIDTRQV